MACDVCDGTCKCGDDDLIPDIQANDYTNLINRLKEINLTIDLLKKQYLDKF